MLNNTIIKIKEYTKKRIINFQKYVLKKLIIWKYRLEKKLGRIKIPQIESFTPKILSTREDSHTDLLYELVNNKNVFNIALTGPYGSGKTSVIKTFEYNFGNLTFLNISLATFDGKTLKDDKTSKLEYNILKQVFYKVSHDKVPQSRFKRIINHKFIFFKTVLIFLWIVSVLCLWSSSMPETFIINVIIHKLWLNKLITEWFYLISSSWIIIGLIYFLYEAFDFFINFKIGKLKVSEAELDNKNDKKSIDFENEIDEILYFFDKNKTDVVFIEDLDRFNNTEIYIKLREINCLINNYEPIKKKGKVTFVYAVRDNFFNETERTKFFDVILPVIPVVNYTNSADKFLDGLAFNFIEISDLEEKSKFKDFVEVASRYINDMRTIISICNEFKIYKKILGGSGVDNVKLLAMMIYKNIEPSDFDCLDKKRGYVFQLFENRNNLIIKEIAQIDAQITEIDENKIDKAEKELFENVKELRRFYYYTFVNLVNKNLKRVVRTIVLDDNELEEDEFLKDENFIKILTNSDIQFTHSAHAGIMNSGFSFESVGKEVDRKSSYSARYERIKNKEKVKTDKFNKERRDLLLKKQSITSKSLSQILITKESDDYFNSTFYDFFEKTILTEQLEKLENKSIIGFKGVYSHKLNNKNLIDFFIREGHIDENYERFISKYNGNHKENQTFLLSLSNRKALDFQFKIKDISSLIKDINDNCFNQKEILNFYLMDYLILSKNQIQLNLIFQVLKNQSENSVSFIDKYLDYAIDKNKQEFLNELIKHWKNIYVFILNETSYFPEKYITLLFKFLNAENLKSINLDNIIGDYIVQMSDLSSITFTDGNEIKVEHFLKDNDVKFGKIVYNVNCKKLIDFIYKNDLYEINIPMIILFVELYKVNAIDLKNLQTANFTTINESGSKELIEYINKNMSTYVDEVFLELESNINEEETSILMLLNNNDLTRENSFQIIEKSPTIINDLSIINDYDLWGKLFKHNRLKICWENFFEYYNKFDKIDEILLNYLNNEKVYNTLSEFEMTNIGDDLRQLFSEEIITCGINDISFSILAKQLPLLYDIEELEECSENRMRILIKNGLVDFDQNSFEILNEKYPNLSIEFIRKNKDKFLMIHKELELNVSIIQDFLKLNEYSDEDKVLVIKNINDETILSDKEVLKDLCKLLSKNKKINISEIVLNALLSSDVDEASRVNLFNIYYTKLESIKVLNARIKSLGKPYDTILGRSHLKIQSTDYNRVFCQNLQHRYIGEPKEEKGMIKAIPKAVKK